MMLSTAFSQSPSISKSFVCFYKLSAQGIMLTKENSKLELKGSRTHLQKRLNSYLIRHSMLRANAISAQ